MVQESGLRPFKGWRWHEPNNMKTQPIHESRSSWGVPSVPLKPEATGLSAVRQHEGEGDQKPNLLIRASQWTPRQWAVRGMGAIVVMLVLIAILLPFTRDTEVQRQRLMAKLEEQTTAQMQRSSRAAPNPSSADSLSSMDANKVQLPDVAPHAESMLAAAPAPPVAQPSSQSNASGVGASAASPNVPMIARSVSLTIVAKNFDTARTKLDAILARYQGYSAQLTVNTPENAPRSLQAAIRVPAPALSAALSDLRSLGRIENETQSGEEVTQQHADLVARLKTARDTEDRLRAILQQRTGKIEDVLQVEEEIARVRGQIESMEADQKGLEHRVDFASVDLQISDEYKAPLNPPATSISTKMNNALVEGYQNAVGLLLGIVLFLAQFGPVLLILAGIFFVPAMFVWRRYRRMLAKAQTQS